MTSLLNIAKSQRALWMLIGLCVVMTFASPVFLTRTNLLNVALAVSVTALLAAGQTYVIILAEIDLSVGAVLGFTAAVTALTLEGSSAGVAVLVGVGTGALIGLVNGLFVTKARMPSFIVTLAMMSVLSGLTLQVTSGNPVAVDDYSFQNIGQAKFAGVPVPVCLMLIGFAVLGVLLARTRYGRFVYATGDNVEAAELSGIRVDRVKITAFVISGVLASVGGFILSARLSSANPTAGVGLELQAIAAVIIGGTSLAGGRGRVIGTLFGALVLGVIDNGMNLLDVSPFLQDVVKGAVILLAVFLDRNVDAMRAWFQPRRTESPKASPVTTTTGGNP